MATDKYSLHEPEQQLQEEQKYNMKPNIQQGDDPLIQQLPVELQQYVKRPSENQSQLVFVERDTCATCVHASLATLCCCWSLCRCHLIKQGEIALTQYGDEPQILGPGRHVLLSPANEFKGIRDFRDPVIIHGPLHIIRVEMGQLGYALNTEDGKPMLLSRGQHIINSLSFVWKKFVNFSQQMTELEQLQVIRIETGKIGYAYRMGNLVILKPGLHLIEPPDRFGDILSTQMQILDLPLGLHETSDYVTLAIKAAVFYRIVEPEKTLVRIQNIRQQISETAVATLAGIIRASSLSDLGSRSQGAKPFYDSADDSGAQKIPFYQRVHDEFIQQLHDHVLDEWGIEIQNIRIESLKINDPILQKNISNNAIDVSRQHNKYIMLQKQKEIMIVEADTAAARLQIETERDTSTVRALAQAEADAIIIKAKAQKDAIELKGKGENEYSRLLESTKLGQDMSVMKIQADALKNLKQVAYIPHLPQMLEQGGIFGGNNPQYQE